MITLITGLPGAGKTLYALNLIKKEVEGAEPIDPDDIDAEYRHLIPTDGKRECQYNGIPGLKLPWIPLADAQNWHKANIGSFIVVDECQRIFPPRASGSAVPAHVSAFETHRHRGMDIYLITQDQGLLDFHVRKLVGRFIHVKRKLGHNFATVAEFSQCCDPKSPTELTGAIKTVFPYPKEAFEWYKSSQLHTVKKRWPLKFLLLPVAVAAVAACGWLVLHTVSANHLTKSVSAQTETDPNTPAGATAQTENNPASAVFAGHPAALTTAQYVDQLKPRVAEIPYSAPAYDALVKPVSAPRVEICVQVGDDCTCYTQQGTRLPLINPFFCRTWVTNGGFNPFVADPAPGQNNAPTAPAANQTLQISQTAPTLSALR